MGLHEQTIPDGHQLGGDTYSWRVAFTCCCPIHFPQIRTADSRRKQVRTVHGESGDSSTKSVKVFTQVQDLKIAEELAAERKKETEEV